MLSCKEVFKHTKLALGPQGDLESLTNVSKVNNACHFSLTSFFRKISLRNFCNAAMIFKTNFLIFTKNSENSQLYHILMDYVNSFLKII